MGEKNPNQRRLKSDLVDTQTRRNFVLELRKAGVPYRDIARAAIKRFGVENLPRGYDCLYCAQDVKRELEKLIALNQNDVTEIRRMELERLDAVIAGIWKRARGGELGAIDRFVRLAERRAKLQGLDVAASIDITSKGEQIGKPAPTTDELDARILALLGLVGDSAEIGPTGADSESGAPDPAGGEAETAGPDEH